MTCFIDVLVIRAGNEKGAEDEADAVQVSSYLLR